MREGRSWYQVLQVDPQAEPEILEAAYRRLARKYHPDVATWPDAGVRMKEINAAYAVLRDPRQRAAYDRQLLERATVAEQEEDLYDLEDDAGSLFACHRHRSVPAVGTCGDCSVGLCGSCFDLFQPPTCPACMISWAEQRRWEILPPAIWFFGVLLVFGVGFLALLGNMGQERGPMPSLAVIGWVYLGIYMLASLPSGFRVVGFWEEEFALSVFLAAVLGPFIAPFRMLKVYLDLREVGRLEALARDAG
jgi:DnaJ domain